MSLTPEQRLALEEQLAAFAGAEANIRKAMEPLRIALEGVTAARDVALQANGVEHHGDCECGKPLFTGDEAHHCLDGELLCEECAPTWADIREQMETDPGADLVGFNAALEAHLDAGGAITDKLTFALNDEVF